MNYENYTRVSLTYIYDSYLNDFFPSDYDLNRSFDEILIELYYDYEDDILDDQQNRYYNEEFMFKSYCENIKPEIESTKSLTEFDCPICLDCINQGDTIYTLKCSHSFHEECTVKWIQQCQTCPLCRIEIDCIQLAPPISTMSDK
jgi:hypothetical protein